MDLNLTIQALLVQRGKTGASLVDYTLVDNSDGTGPHVATWNATTLGPLPTQGELDAITPAQIASYQAAQLTAQFTLTSRQKDILAMVGLVVRAKGLAAWNAMTTPQKVTATLAEADAWATIRAFVEANT
jgi:hypothetical protein